MCVASHCSEVLGRVMFTTQRSSASQPSSAKARSQCGRSRVRGGQDVQQVRGDGGGEGGPGPDLDPQCRGGVQGWRRTRGRRLARARTAPLRWPRLPTRSGPRSCGAIGDQREAVRSGGRARHPCRHHSGERDLIQAEGGGRCGAYRDGKTGKPQRGLSRPRRPTGTGHRRPAIRGRHRDGPRAAYSAPRACSSDGLRRCRERRREGSTRLGAAVTRSR
jgi:hypothetical protein